MFHPNVSSNYKRQDVTVDSSEENKSLGKQWISSCLKQDLQKSKKS